MRQWDRLWIYLRKVFPLLLDIVLDPQQKSRLPLVQLAKLVELEELISESFLVAGFNGLNEVNEELMLSC